MSKSKGEFLTVSLLEEKGYDPIIYRFFCLQSHYRKQLLFTYDNLDIARNAYNKLVSRINQLKEDGDIVDYQIEKYKNLFKEALENDLNTANALTVLYDALKSDLNDSSKIYLIKDFDRVLSLNLFEKKEIDDNLKLYIEDMIEKRNQAKANKNYDLADEIRNQLQNEGIILKDTRLGTEYEIKK